MIPAHARARHPRLIEREADARRVVRNERPSTRWEKGDAAVGVITAGTPYTYVKEVLPERERTETGGCRIRCRWS